MEITAEVCGYRIYKQVRNSELVITATKESDGTISFAPYYDPRGDKRFLFNHSKIEEVKAILDMMQHAITLFRPESLKTSTEELPLLRRCYEWILM